MIPLINKNLDLFQMAADWIHLVCILVFLLNICWIKDAKGLSGKSQILYTIVFLTRYYNVTWNPISIYHVTLKIAFTSITLYTAILIYYYYKDKRTRQEDDFRIRRLILPCAAVALFTSYPQFEIFDIFWSFSIFLEAVSMLPQINLTEKNRNKKPHKLVLLYILFLFVYRALYIIHWTRNFLFEHYYFNAIAMAAAVVQCLIFSDFLLTAFLRLFKKGSDSNYEVYTRMNNEPNVPDVRRAPVKQSLNHEQLYSIVLTPDYLFNDDKVNLIPSKEILTKY